MPRSSIITIAILLAVSTSACAQNSQDAHLVNQALAAAPDELKEGAKVLAYTEDGTYRTVREGSNGLVCVSDNANQEGFEVVCFHQDVEAYMSRGRDLRAEGMSGRETIDAREAEIADGTLAFTEGPTTLYIRFGEEAYYDEESEEVVGSNLRYVIYTPYATVESTGLPSSPSGPGAPWIMNPGSWRAHIMVTPAQN